MTYSGCLIVVRDIERAKAFYSEFLGQEIKLDLGGNVAYEGFSLQEKVVWGDFIDRAPEEIETASDGGELYFETDDYDGFKVRLEAKEDLQYVHREKVFPWGQRSVRMYDPDGHIAEVAESMPAVVRRLHSEGKSFEEIIAMTMYPEEFVQASLDGKMPTL